jgi:YcxB-like protein
MRGHLARCGVTLAQPASPAEPLTFEFTWDQAEHARLIRAVTRHQLTGWLRRSALGLVFGGLAVFLIGVPFVKPGVNPWTVWRAAAPWVVTLGVWYALLRLGLPYMSARSFRRDNHCARHPMRRIMSADGIRIECETTSTAVQWSGVHGVVETPEFFLFYVTPACAVQLPKRAIVRTADLVNLRGLLREKLGDRAQLQSSEGGAAA